MSSPKKLLTESTNVLSLISNINKINEEIKELENKGIVDSFDIEMEILTKYPEFYENYPFLVKKLCKKDNLEMLYKMVNNLMKVESGEKSLASVEHVLGEELAEKYLYPVVGKK